MPNSFEQAISDVLDALKAQGLGIRVSITGPVTVHVYSSGTPTHVMAPANDKEQASKTITAEREPVEIPTGEDPASMLPGEADLLREAIYGVKGNLTGDKLVEFARNTGHTVAAAHKLIATLGKPEFDDFLHARNLGISKGLDGGYRMAGLRKVADLEDLKPGSVPGVRFGKAQHDLLMAVTGR